MTYKKFHCLFYLLYFVISFLTIITGIRAIKDHEQFSVLILALGILEMGMTIFGFFRYRKPNPF